MIAEEIRARGVLTWQDITDIRSGKKLEREITLGLDKADAVLSMLTPASLASDPVCLLEIGPLLNRRRRGEAKDLIVAPRNLGDRAAIAEATIRRYGVDLTADWMPVILPAGEAVLTPAEAVPIANAVLGHFFPRGGNGHDELRIGLHSRAFTPGFRDLEVDWTSLFDVERRSRGTPDQWARAWRAIRDLQHTLARHTAQRRVLFDGQAHLTAGLLAGLAFSRSSGFQVGVLGGGARWDQGVPDSSPADVAITEEPQSLESTTVAVELELSRSVTARVSAYYARLGTVPRLRILVVPSAPSDRWVDPSSAGALASYLGRMIRDAVDRTAARQVDLFYAGPLSLAVLLGAEVGSLEASLQLFEFEDGAYHNSIRIPQEER